jgi:hypothetical protein
MFGITNRSQGVATQLESKRQRIDDPVAEEPTTDNQTRKKSKMSNERVPNKAGMSSQSSNRRGPYQVLSRPARRRVRLISPIGYNSSDDGSDQPFIIFEPDDYIMAPQISAPDLSRYRVEVPTILPFLQSPAETPIATPENDKDHFCDSQLKALEEKLAEEYAGLQEETLSMKTGTIMWTLQEGILARAGNFDWS